MSISIITPSKGGGRFLPTCINGIVSQNIDDKIDHIILESGSVMPDDLDNLNKIIEEKNNKNYSCMISYESDNGYWEAVNKGISMANSEYIAFCNTSDFYSYEGWFKLAINHSIVNDVDCVWANTSIVDESDISIVKSFGGYSAMDIRNKPYSLVNYKEHKIGFIECTAVFKKSIIDKLLPFPNDPLPWFEMQRRFYKLGFKSLFLNAPVAVTRLHHDSITGNLPDGYELSRVDEHYNLIDEL